MGSMNHHTYGIRGIIAIDFRVRVRVRIYGVMEFRFGLGFHANISHREFVLTLTQSFKPIWIQATRPVLRCAMHNKTRFTYMLAQLRVAEP